MRFAGRVAAANYIAAGKASASQSSDMQAIARQNAPDYQELSETAINEQAKNYKQAQDVRADIAEAGLMAQARVEMQRAENDIVQAKRDGKIGAAKGAMISQAGGLIGNSLSKPPESLTKPFEPTDTSMFQKALDKYRSQKETEGQRIEELRSQLSDDGSSFDTSTGSSTGGSSTSGGDGGSVTPPPAGKKSYSQEEIQSFAINAGFTPDESKLVSRIAMGESSGNPMAFNGKGADQSYGLMQINMLGDMGPERRAEFGLTSNDQLYDPQTNMNAAYKIYKQQGWGAWGAYTNGSYLNF